MILKMTIPAELRVKMIRLGIRPSDVARAAFAREVSRRENLILLKKAQLVDPRLTAEDLRRPTRRTRRILGQ